eukprot:scaffold113327_cov66-Phaeocystis_antarctica.AAC.3
MGKWGIGLWTGHHLERRTKVQRGVVGRRLSSATPPSLGEENDGTPAGNLQLGPTPGAPPRASFCSPTIG